MRSDNVDEGGLRGRSGAVEASVLRGALEGEGQCLRTRVEVTQLCGSDEGRSRSLSKLNPHGCE